MPLFVIEPARHGKQAIRLLQPSSKDAPPYQAHSKKGDKPMKNATRIATLAGAAAFAAFATSASAHNPITCTEVSNLQGEQQIAAFNELEPKSAEPVLTNPKPEMHRAGGPSASMEDNTFHKDLTDKQKISIVVNTCSEGKFELATDAVTEAMKLN